MCERIGFFWCAVAVARIDLMEVVIFHFFVAFLGVSSISEEDRIFLLEVAEGKMEVVLVHHHLQLSAQFMEEELLGDFVC